MTGVINVNANYAEPIIINNIGQAANWISFKLQTYTETDEATNVTNTLPGVAIGLSTSNGYVAVLSAQEFWTIETIINEINLTAFKWQASLAYLDIDQFGGTATLNNQQGYNVSGGYGYQPNYQQPPYNNGYQQNFVPNYLKQGNNYQNNGYQAQNNGGYGYQQGQGQYQQQRPQNQQAAPNYNKAPYRNNYQQPQQPTEGQQEDNNFIRPVQQQKPAAPRAVNEQPNLQPRENKQEGSILNFNTVEQTPVYETSMDNDEALDAIFGDDAKDIFKA